MNVRCDVYLLVVGYKWFGICSGFVIDEVECFVDELIYKLVY